MKSSKLSGPGMLVVALFIAFLFLSGLWIKLLVLIFCIKCFQLILNLSHKDYDKPQKSSKPKDLPPALAEKLAKRN